MSAISGAYYLDGRPVDAADLARMADVLVQRGPDASAMWQQGPVGLVHRMLWTTPESLHERLPLVSEAGDLALTVDARLDNRGDLISALGLDGRPSAEVTDGKLILHAYQRWGEECAAKLLGDFAFAIWDARERKLVCARDPVGVKSLYYYCSANVFAFATEIKALLCLSAVPRLLNEVRVADFLVPSFRDRDSTFYRGIFRLPPAHIMVARVAGIQVRAYWRPDSSRQIRLRSDEEYAESFREIFREAVRCRLRSTYAVGSALSGGLDSSSIACVAGRVLATEGGTPLHTFSAIFPSLPAPELKVIDERPFIEAVLALNMFQPYYIRADCLSPLGDLARMLRQNDEAFIAPNLYMHWALYGAAQRQNTRVFLDGLDGDTTVSHGLGYLAELAGTGKWRLLVQEATALATTSHPSYTPRRIIREYGVEPLIPEAAVRVWRRLRGQPPPGRNTGALVNPDLARRVGLAQRLQLWSRQEQAPRTERDAHLRGLTSPLIPYTLELADKAAAAFGLETRYPFFDQRLIEFCLALPPEQKLHAGWTRAVMRRAMSGILPGEVQWRRHKANLSPNFSRQLLNCERETLEGAVFGDTRVIGKYVNMSELRAAYHRYDASPTQAPEDAKVVYRAVILAAWLEQTGLG